MNNTLKKIMTGQWTELAARWILGMTFIYAGFHKTLDPASFARIIYGYGLFPDLSVNLIAMVVPFIEIFSGIALVSGVYPRSAALVVTSLLFLFITAISINLVRGYEFDCGCFSLGKTNSSALQLLIRDIIYIAMGFRVFLHARDRKWCVQTDRIKKRVCMEKQIVVSVRHLTGMQNHH